MKRFDLALQYIPGSDDYYVDIYGNVYSLYHYKNGNIRVKKMKLNRRSVLSPYKTVMIKMLDGEYKTYYVHRLMLASYNGMELEQKDRKMVVDHIDEDKTNNALFNLQYITQSQNIKKHYEHKNDIEFGNFWGII